MGKGDRKTARGKRFAGSHGNVRQAGKASTAATTTQPKKAVVRKAPAKKAPARKAAARKA